MSGGVKWKFHDMRDSKRQATSYTKTPELFTTMILTETAIALLSE